MTDFSKLKIGQILYNVKDAIARAGLLLKQDIIDTNNKLASDLVDDTNQTNKFVTAEDKTTWSGKQDALVSGTNIKTINNESILGSGNIEISSGVKDILQIGLNANVTLPSVSAYTRQKIPFNTEIYKKGNNLTFDTTNNNIIIGENVNHIKVTLVDTIFGNNAQVIAEAYSRINKNDTEYAVACNIDIHLVTCNQCLPNIIIPVTKNDIINFSVTNANTVQKLLWQASTYALVEVID